MSLPSPPLLYLVNTGNWLNPATVWLFAAVLIALFIAFLVARATRNLPEGNINPALLRTFNARLRAWVVMYIILAASLLIGYTMTVVLCGLVSFWALREFITMTPTRRADHRTLFWIFFVFTPIQYLLVGLGRAFVDPQTDWAIWWAAKTGLEGLDFYGLYSIMIPVYGSLYISARIALSGDSKRFLERSAKIQVGMLICVYSLSYAPALLHLELQTWKPEPALTSGAPLQFEQVPDPNETAPDEGTVASGQPARRPWTEGSRPGLLFYFVLIVQLGDLFQYVWGQWLGRRPIAPDINASRTWEGFIGGTCSTAVVGALLWWVTPFRIWEAGCMAFVTAVMGFAGGMTMSAIKRDRGVKDTGTLVQGHAGVLDRIDSICFAAPVFFHLTRYFFAEF